MPLVIANKRRAPVAVLSPTKRTAVIECFNNNGLHKRRGYWWGTPEGKHISGVTVADLARDGIFSVVINLRHGSARLTERGQWFARTLIEAANEALDDRFHESGGHGTGDWLADSSFAVDQTRTGIMARRRHAVGLAMTDEAIGKLTGISRS
jgi:hypothetical protein